MNIKQTADAARQFLTATAVPIDRDTLRVVTEELHVAAADLTNELDEDTTTVMFDGWSSPTLPVPDNLEGLDP